MDKNLLYYGDNLDVLRRYVKDETVDLVYLDPPFNSNATYNVLFREQNGTRAASQIQAFEDTWQWDEKAARMYFEVVENGGQVSEALQAFRRLVGDSTMLAYLAMMAPRLVELRRALKPTGSIYLHCDPTASHYLKLLMDAVFGPGNFCNEVIWKRTTAHSSSKRYGPVHDVLLYYGNGPNRLWNPQFTPHSEEYLREKYCHDDGDGRRYLLDNLTAAGTRRGSSGSPWRGIDPSARGYHWKFTIEHLEELEEAGRIYWPTKGAVPRYKRYLDEVSRGMVLQDIFDDIFPINSQAQERLGYQTQKPEALLERIIQASSNEGDVVLDSFCGCGTTIAVAQRLGRRWIGIDITYLAIALIRRRLRDTYGQDVDKTYEVIGEPVSLPDAKALAKNDPWQFQWWALDLVHARPADQKKGADKGIDGRIYFHEKDPTDTKQIIISVKAGSTGAGDVRDLLGVVESNKAAIGVLISMQEPTGPMREAAASAGLYESPWGKHPRLQLLTVEQLLEGKRIDCPPPSQVSTTFKKAARHTREQGQQLALEAGEED